MGGVAEKRLRTNELIGILRVLCLISGCLRNVTGAFSGNFNNSGTLTQHTLPIRLRAIHNDEETS